eukprot:10944655-Lingulodinium_polyedra.AAC.1
MWKRARRKRQTPLLDAAHPRLWSHSNSQPEWPAMTPRPPCAQCARRVSPAEQWPLPDSRSSSPWLLVSARALH